MDNFVNSSNMLNRDYINNDIHQNIYQVIFNNEYMKSIPNTMFDSNYFYVNNIKINIFSDNWDFSSLCIDGKIKSNYKYNFTNIENDIYKSILKGYIIYLIFSTTIHREVNIKILNSLKPFVNYLSQNYINSIDDISLNTIKSFEKEANYVNRYNSENLSKHRKYILNFLIYLESIYDKVMDYEIIEYLNQKDIRAIKSHNIMNRTKTLPDDFFNNFNDLIYNKLITNEYESYDELMFLSCLLILANCGIRPMESLIIPRDCLEIDEIDDDKKVYYLHYRSTKKSSDKYSFCRTLANEKVADAVKIIRTKYYNENEDFLFEKRPGNTEKLRKYFYNICAKNCKKLNLVNTNNQDYYISNTIDGYLNNGKNVINKSLLKELLESGLKSTDCISLPHLYQFRVYFATSLALQGVPYPIISMMLNQNDEKMYGYYVRAKQIKVELQEKEMTIDIAESILKDEYKLHGPRSRMRTKQIKRYLPDENNKLSKDDNTVNKNLEKETMNYHKLAEEVVERLPMRMMEGGCCIKGEGGLDCSFDNETNLALCADKLCPNQHHFIFNLSYYYEDFLNKKIDIKYYLIHNRKRAAEKELKNMKYMINHKLNVELQELKEKIDYKTLDNIIEKYPDLLFFKENYDEVKGEIEKWKNITIKELTQY